MNVKEVKEVLKVYIEAQLEFPDSAPVPCLLGSYGIGKTRVVRDLSDEMGFNFVLVNATGFDPSLWCIPYIGGGDRESAHPRDGYEFKIPSCFLDPQTLIFVDEFDKCHSHMVSPFLSLFTGRDFFSYKVKCPIVVAVNNPSVLYKYPALRSRLFVIDFPVPTPTELIEYLSYRYSSHLPNLPKDVERLVAVLFEYIRKSGEVHEGGECPLWTPRTIEGIVNLMLKLKRVEFGYVSNVLKPLFGDKFSEFWSFYEGMSYPDPHGKKEEILKFLKGSPQSAHYAFVYVYTTHLLTCDEKHPIGAVEFVLNLPTSLIDAFMSVLKSAGGERNQRLTYILNEISMDERAQRVVSNYTLAVMG